MAPLAEYVSHIKTALSANMDSQNPDVFPLWNKKFNKQRSKNKCQLF